MAGNDSRTRSAESTDLAEEREMRSVELWSEPGSEQRDLEKAARTKPIPRQPLLMIFQQVNIDPFGFADWKRSQFGGARHGQQAVAHSACVLATRHRSGRLAPSGSRSESERAEPREKRPNEANCLQPLLVCNQDVRLASPANPGRRTKPSMREPLSSEAVQILCSGAPAHPPHRRLRSIWPISDRSADELVCTPQHIL